MKGLVKAIAKALVDNPDQVQVRMIEGEQVTLLELRVHPSDMGKVIGREGRMAKSIRTILAAAELKLGRRVTLEIVSVEPLQHEQKEPLLKKLYVGNLPFQTTEEELGNWFKQAGITPANVTLVQDRFTGQPRGFGFVEVNNDDDANRAIQSLHGQDFMGRKLVVNEARPTREGGGGGGGRGGYGRERGGRGGGGGRERH
jgi:cold-inducible RNA-binding protein